MCALVTGVQTFSLPIFASVPCSSPGIVIRLSGMTRPGVRMYSSAQSLTDPPGSSVIASGVAWVEGAALGSVATAIAIIAVAAIGLLMLSGRLDLRRGITVIFGCFLLFGASGIEIGRAHV